MCTFLFLYAINDAIFILAQCRIPVNTKGQGVQLVSFERNRGPDSCNLTRIIDRSVILIEFLLQEKKKGKHIRDLSKKNLSLDKTMKIIRMEETLDQRETLIIINVHLTMSNMLRRKKHDDSNFVH